MLLTGKKKKIQNYLYFAFVQKLHKEADKTQFYRMHPFLVNRSCEWQLSCGLRASCLMKSKSSLMLMKTSCLTALQTPSLTLWQSPFKLPQFPAPEEQLSCQQPSAVAEIICTAPLLLMELPAKPPHWLLQVLLSNSIFGRFQLPKVWS